MARRDGLLPALAVVAALALGACGPSNEDKGIKEQQNDEWDNAALNPGSTQDAGSGVQLTQSVDTFTPPRPTGGRMSDSTANVIATAAGAGAVRNDSAAGDVKAPGTAASGAGGGTAPAQPATPAPAAPRP